MERDVGVAGHEVRDVDDVREPALRIAQIGLIQLPEVLAREHVVGVAS